MATVSLSATPRSGKGTGIARKLRQAGEVPAVIYGHAREPQSLTLNTREIDKLLAQIAGTTTVVELSIGGSTVKTLIREVQRPPFKRDVIHVDFQELVAGEKVNVSIPIRFNGVPAGVREGGGILEEVMHQLHLRVDPSAIPDQTDTAAGCVVVAPRAVGEETPVVAVEAAVAAPAEPELIRKPKAEDEEAAAPA